MKFGPCQSARVWVRLHTEAQLSTPEAPSFARKETL